MLESKIYETMAERTGGTIFIGVVGPVRTGKSTFIKKFMEALVLPGIEDPYVLERTRDELPQSGSGRTIMTAEPKFIPERAVKLVLGNGIHCAVRMADSVGFLVPGAAGNEEDGAERRVMTPWYDTEIPMSQAAEEGTRRVISDHSTIGILVTTDGSVCGLERENYLAAEERAAQELNRIGKPYTILLNCADPETEQAAALARELTDRYGHTCIPVNCLHLERETIEEILLSVLRDFPVSGYRLYLPAWLDALDEDSALRCSLFDGILAAAEKAGRIGDAGLAVEEMQSCDMVSTAEITEQSLATGFVAVQLSLMPGLFYETLSAESGVEIRNDRELLGLLRSYGTMNTEYRRVHEALESVRETGYGIIMPTEKEMTLQEPEIIRQGGHYGVRLKASAPAIHLMMTDVETEVSPAIGGEKASDEVINFLLQGFDGDVNRIWDSNIFGKPLNDIAGEGLVNKIQSLPEDARLKLRTTIQRIINEGSGGLICILL